MPRTGQRFLSRDSSSTRVRDPRRAVLHERNGRARRLHAHWRHPVGLSVRHGPARDVPRPRAAARLPGLRIGGAAVLRERTLVRPRKHLSESGRNDGLSLRPWRSLRRPWAGVLPERVAVQRSAGPGCLHRRPVHELRSVERSLLRAGWAPELVQTDGDRAAGVRTVDGERNAAVPTVRDRARTVLHTVSDQP